MTALTELEERLPYVAQRYHRLVLIVGPAGSGKTPLLQALCASPARPYFNVSLTLSQRLLALTSRERPLRVRRLLTDVVDAAAADVVALDNIELLFDPSLRQDPLALLGALSRNVTLVVAWPGTYAGDALTYAAPGHPEYRRYLHPEVPIIALPCTPHTQPVGE